MTDQNSPPEYRQANAIGRAAIGIAGVGAAVAGGLGAFMKLRVLSQNIFTTVEGTRSFLTSMALYNAVWLVFFMAFLVAGVSLMVAAIKGRSSDIVPGPSLYIMGTTLVIAGMFQLLFGNLELAAVTALVGTVLMITEYRSALL